MLGYRLPKNRSLLSLVCKGPSPLCPWGTLCCGKRTCSGPPRKGPRRNSPDRLCTVPGTSLYKHRAQGEQQIPSLPSHALPVFDAQSRHLVGLGRVARWLAARPNGKSAAREATQNDSLACPRGQRGPYQAGGALADGYRGWRSRFHDRDLHGRSTKLGMARSPGPGTP
eukprot:scaffold435_cov285-Pinguiococcus_pyrenoidosus.AAC.5